MNNYPIVNLDWLAFSVVLADCNRDPETRHFLFNDPEGGRIKEYPGTNLYQRRIILYSDEGEKLLTLLCEPYSKIINPSSALVEVANKWLYMGYSAGFDWITDALYQMHPCHFLSLSRVDICGDFQVTAERWPIICDLADNRAYVQGYKEGALFCTFNDDKPQTPGRLLRARVPKCLSWGSKHSNIKWKLYNKTLELSEYDNEGHRFWTKPYIVDQWEAEGFDVEKVWRLEVSITPMAKFDWRGRKPTLDDVFSPDWVADVFCGCVTQKFKIRRNEGHADRSNDTLLHLFDILGTGKLKTRPPEYHKENDDLIGSLRAAMKQLTTPAIAINEPLRAVWLTTARESVRMGHLEAYFYKTFGFKVEDIETATIDERTIK